MTYCESIKESEKRSTVGRRVQIDNETNSLVDKYEYIT
jgi:hypothetical protein